MQVELRDITEIKPYARNPRVNDGAVESLAENIRAFGWRVPIILDKDGTIIAGHTRLKAAQRLGLTQVPVHVAHGLSPEQCKALRLAENKSHEMSEWNFDLLPIELAELKALDFDIASLGWTPDELSEILAPPANPGECDPDDVPEAPETPITRRGDIWLLGEHRLLCGDSTDPADVRTVMDGEKAAMLWTDPPYGIEIVGGSRVMSQAERRAAGGKTIANDGADPEALRELLRASLSLAVGACKPGSPWYVAGPGGMNAAVFAQVLIDLGVGRHILVWVKDRFVIGRCDYHYRHELLFYGWTPGGAHRSPKERNLDTVWECPRPARSESHPTMKPVALVARALQASSAQGGLVYEPFTGSGTTIIACEQEARRCSAIELEPRYVDVAVRRWEKFTGKTAERVPADGAAGARAEKSAPEEKAPRKPGAKRKVAA